MNKKNGSGPRVVCHSLSDTDTGELGCVPTAGVSIDVISRACKYGLRDSSVCSGLSNRK